MTKKDKALKRLNKVSKKQQLRNNATMDDDSWVLGFIFIGLFIFFIVMIFLI